MQIHYLDCEGRIIIMMMAVLIAVIVAALAGYAAMVAARRRCRMQADEIRTQVGEIENADLGTEFARVSRMTLAGDSLTEVENMDKAYHYLMNRRLPEIIEDLDEIDGQLEGFHVLSARTALETAGRKGADAMTQYRDLAARIAGIIRQAESHQEAVTELREKYQGIRRTLLTKNFSYGPGIDALEKSMKELEELFDEYMKVLETGDLKKTEEILTDLRQRTVTLETALEGIPPVYRNYRNVYPDQIEEIREAVGNMKEKCYGFEFDMDKLIGQVDGNMECLGKAITAIETDNCETIDGKIHEDIEKLYDAIEKEYNARIRFEKRCPRFKEFLEHAEKQEHELLIELDRLSVNYVLSHNELEDAHGLNDTIKRVGRWFRGYEEREEGTVICYSEHYSRMLAGMQDLTNVEKRQKEISDSVSSLFQDERDAEKAIQNFDAELHRLKRSVDNLNLPGLPEEYEQYFLKVSDETVALAGDLGKIQVDMDQIERDLINTQSDIDVLVKKTQEIIDSSTLAQECIQYANRWRGRSDEVAQARQEAVRLFENCDYVKSLDTIAHVLEKVDEGSYRRMEAEYRKKSGRY